MRQVYIGVIVGGLIAAAAGSAGGWGASAGPTASGAQAHSTSTCTTDTKTVQTAVDAFYNDKGVFPNGTGPANAGGTATTQPGQAVDLSALVPTYLRSSPPHNETFTYTDTLGSVQGSRGHGANQCTSKHRAATQACATDAKSVQSAVDAFYSDMRVWPNGTGAANTAGSRTTQPGQAVDLSALVPTYLRTFPPSNEVFLFSDAIGSVQGFLGDRKKPC
jgi:hypothetical protein